MTAIVKPATRQQLEEQVAYASKAMAQLEADKAALMEALKPFADLADAISPGRMFATVHISLIRDAAEAIARLRQEASK